MPDDNSVSTRLEKISRITIFHPAFKAVVNAIQGSLNSFRTAGETICIWVLGDSGCGKTYVSDRFVRLHPEYDVDGQLVKPVLRVRVPSDPTIKGLSTAILEQLHDPFAAKGSEQEMAERIDHLLRLCKTELVILEEMNHFIDAERAKRNLKLANWLKIRIEETGIPFVVEGLPRTKLLFDQDIQLKDRFDGPYMLKPFIWYTAGPDPTLANKPFRSYLHLLSRKVPFDDCIDFGAEENALRFFCASTGVPRRIGKLLKHAAIIAEERHTETLDLHLFEIAYNQRNGNNVKPEMNPFSMVYDLKKATQDLLKQAKRPLPANI